jgi:uncharacterized Tic20 family protein
MSDASDPTQAATGQTQPGWYPDPTDGRLRWWDGQAWGAHQEGAAPLAAPAPAAATGPGTVTNPTQTAMWAHMSGAALLLFTCGFGWVGPLIFYLTQGQNDAFVKDQSAEALNFQITVAIGCVVSVPLMFVAIGFVTLPVIILVGIVFGFLGGTAAGRGEWYRYPFALRLVKVPQAV